MKRWAAGVLATVSPLTGAAEAYPQFPTMPPIVRKSEQERIGELMSKMYDIYEFNKKLGIEHMQPTPDAGKYLEREITEEKEREGCCKEFGVDINRVKKIQVSGTQMATRYQFLDAREEVIATGRSTRMEDKVVSDHPHHGIFKITHILGAKQDMIFQYHEDKNAKWNRVEVSFHPHGQGKFVGPSFSTAHSGYLVGVTPKSLGQHSLALIEELAKKQEASKPRER